MRGGSLLAVLAVGVLALLLLGSPLAHAVEPRHSPELPLRVSGEALEAVKELLELLRALGVLSEGALTLTPELARSVLEAMHDNAELASLMSPKYLAVLEAAAEPFEAVTATTGASDGPEGAILETLAASIEDESLKGLLRRASELASEGDLSGLDAVKEYLESEAKVSHLDRALAKTYLSTLAEKGVIPMRELELRGLTAYSPDEVEAVSEWLKEVSELLKDPEVAAALRELSSALAKLSEALRVGSAEVPLRELGDKLSELAGMTEDLPVAPLLATSDIYGSFGGAEPSDASMLARLANSFADKLSELLQSDRASASRSQPPKAVILPEGLELALFPMLALTALVIARSKVVHAIRLLRAKAAGHRAEERALKSLAGARIGEIRERIIRAYWRAVGALSAVEPKLESETHREYLKRMSGKAAVIAKELGELTRLYELARFSARKLGYEDARRAEEGCMGTLESLRKVLR